MIVVTPLAAALDFRGTYGGRRSHGLFVPPFVNAAGQTLNGYHTIVFTDSTISRGMPLRNNSHSWSFGDPFDPGDSYWRKTENTCYSGFIYCSVNVKETGTMRSDTRVNGTYQTDAVTIYCADTISMFNNDLVRQGIMAINDSSGYPTRPLEQRIERVFLVLQDSVKPGAEPYVWFFPASQFADVCQAGALYIDFASRPPNTRVIAGGHAHVASPGDIVACKDSTGQVKRNSAGELIFGTVLPGASDPDWDWLKTVNLQGLNPGTILPMKGYVVKGNEVQVLDPAKPRGSELLPSGNFRWPVAGRCVWPKRSVYRPEI